MLETIHSKLVSLFWKWNGNKPTTKPEREYQHSFTIDRTQWNRGEEHSYSQLKRVSDGKKDCLGFYLASLGVPEAALISVGHPANLSDSVLRTHGLLGSWLFKGSPPFNDDACFALIRYNDKTELSISGLPPEMKSLREEERERLIKESFAAQDIKVEFVN